MTTASRRRTRAGLFDGPPARHLSVALATQKGDSRVRATRICGSTAMPQGNVKWFDSKKGFGFIISPEGKDVFVHFTSIEGDGFRSLKDGETVDYEQIQGEKGLLAQHVRRLAQQQQSKSGAGQQAVKPA